MTIRKLLKISFIASCLLSLSYVIYKKYIDNRPNEIVTIYPDDEKTKIKPLEAGGIVIANAENSIYESLQANTKTNVSRKVNLLPEPEQPVNINGGAAHAVATTKDPIDNVIASILEHDQESQNQNKQQEADKISIPAKQNILEQAPLGKETSDDLDTLLSEASISTPTPEIEVTPKAVEESEQAVTQQKSLKIIKVTEKSNKLANINKLSSGSYKIQLASVKSEAEGARAYERIKKKHIKILSNSSLTLKKIKHDKNHVFYLVLAGNYTTAGQAKAVCKKLAQRQQSCIVTSY